MSLVANRRNEGIWSSLCAPAKLYGIFSLVSVAGYVYSQEVLGAISHGLFGLIWVFILNLICGEGWTGLSWVLVIVPIIITVILFTIGFTIGLKEATAAEAESRMRLQQ